MQTEKNISRVLDVNGTRGAHKINTICVLVVIQNGAVEREVALVPRAEQREQLAALLLVEITSDDLSRTKTQNNPQ
jgi:hypothetical protein